MICFDKCYPQGKTATCPDCGRCPHLCQGHAQRVVDHRVPPRVYPADLRELA